ncbi:MAG: hypothetical protein Q9221_002566 [Calogaya cf. arnoldii]
MTQHRLFEGPTEVMRESTKSVKFYPQQLPIPQEDQFWVGFLRSSGDNLGLVMQSVISSFTLWKDSFPAMLPEAIASCYVRYKYYESAVLSWVVSASDACGYKTPQPSKRHSITLGSTTPSTTPNTKKYIIPRDEILHRVEQIVNSKPRERVPTYIIPYLRKSIADRERCIPWFQEYYAGDVSVGDSTDAHIHFIEMLKSMLSMLNSIASEPPNLSRPRSLPTLTPIVDLGTETNDKLRYAGLRKFGYVEDLETEAEGSDSEYEGSDSSSERSPIAVSDGIQDNQTRTENIYEAESSTDDAGRLLAVHDLLRRLRQIREYVEDIWSSYHGQHISLIHATIVTNAAIDCAQDLDDRFVTTFPKSPVWGDLVDLVFQDVTAHWHKHHSTLSPETIRDMDMIFLAPTMLLKVFLDVFEGIHGVYDPGADTSKLSCHDKLNRNVLFLDTVIPELALHSKVGIPLNRDRITAGLKDVLDTRMVRLWVVFSFAILCDIHLVLGGDIFWPFKDARQELERARKENHDYVEGTDNTLMSEERRELHEAKIRRDHILLNEDIMMEQRSLVFSPSDYVSHAQKPLFLLSHHPLLCGSLATSFRLDWQRCAIRFADAWHHTSAVLHLHSALKHEGCLPTPVPFLEALQEMYGTEKVFFGKPPTIPEKYLSHYLLVLGFSIQYFATNKRKGAPIQSKESKSKRIRDLRHIGPLIQLLRKQYDRQKGKRLPRLAKLKEVVQQHH